MKSSELVKMQKKALKNLPIETGELRIAMAESMLILFSLRY